MESDLFTCPICYEEYDLLQHMPRIMIPCGHSICFTCLSRILNSRNGPKCPLDKKSMSKKLEEFPINFTIRELLENRAKAELCEIHKKEITFICLTEKKRICNKCLFEHQKSGHEVRDIESSTEELNHNIQEIEKSLSLVKSYREKLTGKLKEKRLLEIQGIQNKFQEIRKVLGVCENELIYEVNTFFNMKQEAVNNFVGENSKIVKEFQQNLSSLKDVNQKDSCMDPSFSTNLRQKIHDLKAQINLDEIQINMEPGPDRTDKSFNVSFIDSDLILSKTRSIISDPFENLNEPLLKNKPEKETLWDQGIGLTRFEIKSRFTFNQSGDLLKIQNELQTAESLLVDLAKYVKAKTVQLILHENLSNEDFQLLHYIWKRLKGPSNLWLTFRSDIVSDEMYRIFLKTPKTFSTVDINIQGIKFSEGSKMFDVIQKVLANMVNLKQVICDMSKTMLPDKTLEKVVKNQALDLTKLEVLYLDLNQTNIADDDISSISVDMPNLKYLTLGLCQTNITDKALEIFSKNTLTSAELLQEVHLRLRSTNISDIGLHNLLSSFKGVIKIELDLWKTQITDKAVQYLSMLNFNIIEYFDVRFTETQVTDLNFHRFFKAMPNVKFFSLSLAGTSITDNSLHLFAQNVLPSMKTIESLNIWLLGTNTTDSGAIRLLSNLCNVKELKLNFNSTGVSDLSIRPFIQERLPIMKNLIKFDLRVDYTNVSQEVRNEIQLLKQKINTNS